MSEGIIEIGKIPTNCCRCSLCYNAGTTDSDPDMCMLTGKSLEMVPTDEKPIWCPIKKIPILEEVQTNQKALTERAIRQLIKAIEEYRKE